MAIRSRTLRSENEVSSFLDDNNLGNAVNCITSNSSGMPVIYFNDIAGVATQVAEPGQVGIRAGLDDALADADDQNEAQAEQRTNPIGGLLGMKTILVEVVSTDQDAALTINLVPRWSNSSEPDAGNSGDWSRELRPSDPDANGVVTFSEITYQVTAIPDGRALIEIPVIGSYLSLAYWASAGDEGEDVDGTQILISAK